MNRWLRRRPKLEMSQLVDSSGVVRADRRIQPFSTLSEGGETWSSEHLAPDRPALFLFLSGNCDGCVPFATALRLPQASGLVVEETVIVSIAADDDAGMELVHDRAADILALRGPEPWASFHVHGAPFFALLDPVSHTLLTEGVAWDVGQVRRHCLAAYKGEDLGVPRMDANE